jgi:hypothetical protein
VGGVGEATNATWLPTVARRSTQRFGDLTFGISLVDQETEIAAKAHKRCRATEKKIKQSDNGKRYSTDNVDPVNKRYFIITRVPYLGYKWR